MWCCCSIIVWKAFNVNCIRHLKYDRSMLSLYFSCHFKKYLWSVYQKTQLYSYLLRWERIENCASHLPVFLLLYWKFIFKPLKYAFSRGKPAVFLRCLLLGEMVFPNWSLALFNHLQAFSPWLFFFHYSFVNATTPKSSLKLKY